MLDTSVRNAIQPSNTEVITLEATNRLHVCHNGKVLFVFFANSNSQSRLVDLCVTIINTHVSGFDLNT